MSSSKFFCAECNFELRDEGSVCAECGSSKRRIHLEFKDEIESFEQVRIKKSKKGDRKQKLDYVKGHETSADYGIVHKQRIIDKANDNYSEEIKDIDGTVIHKCEEKLSEHKGHGNDKKKKGE